MKKLKKPNNPEIKQKEFDSFVKEYHEDIKQLKQVIQSLEMLNTLNTDLNQGVGLDILLNKAKNIIIENFPVNHIDIYMASEDGRYLIYQKEKINKEYLKFFEKLLPIKIPEIIKVSLENNNWYSKVMSGNEIRISSSLSDIESIIMAFIEGNYESLPLKKYISKLLVFFRDKTIIASLPLILNNKKIALLDINFKSQPGEDEIRRMKAFAEQVVVILGRKQAEMIILKQNEELKKLNEDKDRFLSIIGHDLRNPFNSILGFTGVLLKNIRKYDIDSIEYFLTFIQKTAQNTFHILDDLLTWSKAQSNKINYEVQRLNLHNVCLETVDIMLSYAINKKISIDISVNEHINLFADVNIVKIVLRNLISNAIKFTNQGGKIEIRAEQKQDMIIVEISDNGIGISTERLGLLFESSQIYSTYGTEEEIGTGLGLLLCKELLEKQNGKIWVESELGKGSSFYFALPCCKEQEEMINKNKSEPS